MVNVDKKICIVTGGTKGIGKAVVEMFSTCGAERVYACGRDQKALDDISVAYSNVEGIKLDVTDAEAVIAFCQSVKDKYGRIDVLVNNAGATRDNLIHKMSDEDWDTVLDVNLKAVFAITKQVAPLMIENGKGSIVNISSIVGLDGNIGQSNYAATKGAIVSLTKSWAKEFARKGEQVRVNAVAPGFTKTAMIEKVPEEILEKIKKKIVLKRLGEVEDIASSVLFLASDAASYITGQVLRVDGFTIF